MEDLTATNKAALDEYEARLAATKAAAANEWEGFDR
jgi:hypothetical protein